MLTNHPKKDDLAFMRLALMQAKKAYAIGEVPVGAVIVRDGKVIARAYNRRETKKNALRHAELDAIDKACRRLGGWRLFDCDLYVTLEPCPMCAGAIVNARIRRVVFGAKDAKAGAFGSVFDMNQYPLNHHPAVESGMEEKKCAGILTDFFHSLRQKRNAAKTISESPDTKTGNSL